MIKEKKRLDSASRETDLEAAKHIRQQGVRL
jgi:hypothetical protein